MPRRKSFKLGPKRRSYGKAFRVNTKGGRVTSISAGGGGFRVNVSSRGTRASARNPITGKSMPLTGGSRRGGGQKRGATAGEQPV